MICSKKNFSDHEEKEYIAGRLFSYDKVIVSLRATLKTFDIKEEEIGLDKVSLKFK